MTAKVKVSNIKVGGHLGTCRMFFRSRSFVFGAELSCLLYLPVALPKVRWRLAQRYSGKEMELNRMSMFTMSKPNGIDNILLHQPLDFLGLWLVFVGPITFVNGGHFLVVL